MPPHFELFLPRTLGFHDEYGLEPDTEALS